MSAASAPAWMSAVQAFRSPPILIAVQSLLVRNVAALPGNGLTIGRREGRARRRAARASARRLRILRVRAAELAHEACTGKAAARVVRACVTAMLKNMLPLGRQG